MYTATNPKDPCLYPSRNFPSLHDSYKWVLSGVGGEDVTPTKPKKQAVSSQRRAEVVPFNS
jgi:hypothetical protein